MVSDNRAALNYLLAEQGGICTIAMTSWCTWVNNSGIKETQMQGLKKQATWLKKKKGWCLFRCIIWFTWYQQDLALNKKCIQTFGIILLTVATGVSLAGCVLSGVLNTSLSSSAVHQMASLSSERQKRVGQWGERNSSSMANSKTYEGHSETHHPRATENNSHYKLKHFF